LLEFWNYTDYTILAGIGAEGERTPIVIPSGYGISVAADSKFYIAYDFINLWGIPAVANVSLYVVYNLTWIPVSQSVTNLVMILLDVTGFPNGTATFNIPDSCPQTNNVYTKQLTFTWPYENVDVVYLVGHLHIGSISIALTNSKSQVICKAVPSYDPFGFVDSMGTCSTPSNGEFVTKSSYTITVEYGCNGYQEVMGMLIGYITAANPDVIPAGLRKLPKSI